jgi:hypothetical protein
MCGKRRKKLTGIDRMNRIKTKGKRQRVKVKDGVTIAVISFLPFTFLLLPFFILSIPV